MLLKIREKSKGFFAYLLVGLIAIAFSLWGVDSLFSAMYGDPNELAKVNKASISQVEVDKLAQKQMQQLMQNNQVNPDQINLEMLQQFALSNLIQLELLSQLAHKTKMNISDRQVERHLVRMQVFQDAEGRFAEENFTQVLRQEGLSPNAFRNQLKQDLLNQQILGGVAASEFALKNEIETFQQLAGQQRSYTYKIFNTQDYTAKVKPTNEQIQAFYEEHQLAFQRPEQVKVDYVIFDPTSLLSELQPTKEQLEAEYQAFVSQQKNQAASYSAAHILLEFSSAKEKQAAEEKLNQIKQEVEAGASFAAKAEEYSADFATAQTGGELGPILAGSFNKDFEQALFSLEKVGQISKPIQTSYGLHLIQLTAKQEAEVASFKEVEAELKQRLIAQPWREAIEAKIEELTNLSFTASNLNELAKAASLKSETSSWLLKNELTSFWQEDAVAKAVFSKEVLEEGWLTEPLALKNGKYLIAQANTYQKQKQLELSEVKKEVTKAVTLQLAKDLAKASAEKELQAATNNPKATANWKKVDSAGLNTNLADAQLNNQAFKLNLKQPLQLVDLNSEQLAIINLLAIDSGKLSEDKQEIAMLKQGLTATTANRMQEKFMQHLQEQAKIVLR